MKHLRAFIAGMVLPGILFPILLLIAWKMGMTTHPHTHLMFFMPWIWGLWNVFYFSFLKDHLPGNVSVKLLLTGAILGLLVALVAVLWVHIPELVGLPSQLHYAPLLVAPIVYALLWRYVVEPLNGILGL